MKLAWRHIVYTPFASILDQYKIIVNVLLQWLLNGLISNEVYRSIFHPMKKKIIHLLWHKPLISDLLRKSSLFRISLHSFLCMPPTLVVYLLQGWFPMVPVVLARVVSIRVIDSQDTNWIICDMFGHELCVHCNGAATNFSVYSCFQTIPVNTTPDNIQVEPGTGHLWLGCHPVVWRMLQHSDDGVSPAPSQVGAATSL